MQKEKRSCRGAHSYNLNQPLSWPLAVVCFWAKHSPMLTSYMLAQRFFDTHPLASSRPGKSGHWIGHARCQLVARLLPPSCRSSVYGWDPSLRLALGLYTGTSIPKPLLPLTTYSNLQTNHMKESDAGATRVTPKPDTSNI